MLHGVVGDESAFFAGLVEADSTLAYDAQKRGCPRCGGRLDRADYPRKPRGLPSAWEDAFSRRFSFCCANQGCRRRITPPSLRFFGRRVYVAAVFVLVCARRMSAAAAGVPKQTARRWRRYFAGPFVQSKFWQVARARFSPPLGPELAVSLLQRFGPQTAVALQHCLRFLSPLSTAFSHET